MIGIGDFLRFCDHPLFADLSLMRQQISQQDDCSSFASARRLFSLATPVVIARACCGADEPSDIGHSNAVNTYVDEPRSTRVLA